jgi:hypothetical protein
VKVKKFIITVGVFCFLSSLAADTQINYTTTNLQLFPKVAHPDGGGFLFAWVSNEDPDFEIYTRAFDSNLSNPSPSTDEDCISKPSPADGHRLHAEAVPSIDPVISDKGAMIAWVNHINQKVYTTRVSSNGYRDYAPVPVHEAAFMTPPEMCSDGAGGLVFASLDGNNQRKPINDRRDRNVLFVWVDGKIFEKELINDIIVSAVLKEYNKPQLNPFVGF